ncbi:hypothetical protein [Acidimangrovimonas sediminis]|uniref:hypothetical protein n=1 Tax=Acidimangrovimonas sediminis TaxID=2056283 RepID=UPI000C80CF66|nr:hypothetical protein [Acidimangrovimonas sediminis]
MYDAACLNATSTSVSLLFAERPALNFAGYVSRIETALRGSFEDTMQLSWDHDDIVTIDVDGSRVMLGYWEAGIAAAPDTCAAVLVLCVGPGPDWRAGTRLARFRKQLCQSVAAAILDQNPAELVLWKDFQGVATPEDFDDLVDNALETAQRPLEESPVPAALSAPTAVATPAPAPDEPAVDARGQQRFGGLPVRRLMDRLVTEIPTTEPMRLPRLPEPLAESADAPAAEGPKQIEIDARADFAALAANDLPDLPPADIAQADRIRRALYPEAAEEEDSKPILAHRLSIYAVNTTLMLVALPVGAALMTYNVLGGEDAKLTARATALTGAAIGIGHALLNHGMLGHGALAQTVISIIS